MTKPGRLIALGLVIGIAACLLIFGTRHSTVILPPGDTNKTDATISPTPVVAVKNPASTATNELPPAPAGLRNPATTATQPPLAPISTEPEFTRLPPETVLENMRTAFRNYLSMFGSNPVGTNPEITQALDGGNRRQTHFISEDDGLRINGRGELIDSWGTPYFFHQLSGTEMEIHSAGPDRVMWTADDLVIK